jgi:hypothetical protein
MTSNFQLLAYFYTAFLAWKPLVFLYLRWVAHMSFFVKFLKQGSCSFQENHSIYHMSTFQATCEPHLTQWVECLQPNISQTQDFTSPLLHWKYLRSGTLSLIPISSPTPECLAWCIAHKRGISNLQDWIVDRLWSMPDHRLLQVICSILFADPQTAKLGLRLEIQW